jgi:cytochrome c peroxidase
LAIRLVLSKYFKINIVFSLIYWVSFFFFFISCNENENLKFSDFPHSLNYPVGFPPMDIPPDNALTVLRIQLGKQLFFDKRLSKDSSVSCSSCHFQENAFADFKAKSIGINNAVGLRNAPSLGNVGYHPYFFRDGGATTLETQILAPIEDVNEMGFSVPEAVKRLRQIKKYNDLAELAYNRPFDAFVLTRAIAAFERTLISGNSRYDQFMNGNFNAINDSEKRGKDLFFSNKTNCSECHSGIDFTNYSFENVGLYETYADTGRERITLLSADKGKFKVPSLRNAEVTAPYMHDGSMMTLEEVLEHFISGGKNHVNKSEKIKPLNLTTQEKTDLINFMKSLTDTEFINNIDYKP